MKEEYTNFDFNANKGKQIAIQINDGKTTVGKNLGVMPDDVVVIEFDTQEVTFGLSEIPSEEIKSVELSDIFLSFSTEILRG